MTEGCIFGIRENKLKSNYSLNEPGDNQLWLMIRQKDCFTVFGAKSAVRVLNLPCEMDFNWMRIDNFGPSLHLDSEIILTDLCEFARNKEIVGKV